MQPGLACLARMGGDHLARASGEAVGSPLGLKRRGGDKGRPGGQGLGGTQGLINKGLTIRVNFKVRSNEGKIV